MKSKKSFDKSKVSLSAQGDNNFFQVKELINPSPTIEQIQNLINTWLFNKSKFLAGKTEIDLSKIVKKKLINRLKKEREVDIQKGIYKIIDIKYKIKLLTQTFQNCSIC